MAGNFTQIEMDKTRNVKFGMNGLIELEELMGKPISEIENGFSMEDLRTFFYVGLKWEDKDLTPEKVGDLMDQAIEKNEEGFNYLAEVMTEAVEKALKTNQSTIPSN